jgi:hypothetical protein
MRIPLGGAMSILREYAEHWFAHTSLRINTPFLLKNVHRTVREVADARPGFSSELREIAMAALGSSERELVHRALAALAVVGQPEDLVAIRALTESPDSWIAGAAGTAAFEIEHGAA